MPPSSLACVYISEEACLISLSGGVDSLVEYTCLPSNGADIVIASLLTSLLASLLTSLLASLITSSLLEFLAYLFYFIQDWLDVVAEDVGRIVELIVWNVAVGLESELILIVERLIFLYFGCRRRIFAYWWKCQLQIHRIPMSMWKAILDKIGMDGVSGYVEAGSIEGFLIMEVGEAEVSVGCNTDNFAS
ncbi:hypothetical protein F2Q70_00038333 [Brassica cretica]|uniref:Uncharacterized protein n=1 Tax=Brassica cretica TaxID=69181 RepID=A0A8S9K578_BRACR|nr:hypothetical protein F2Q70_00038333 [Brassica cretica]